MCGLPPEKKKSLQKQIRNGSLSMTGENLWRIWTPNERKFSSRKEQSMIGCGVDTLQRTMDRFTDGSMLRLGPAHGSKQCKAL